MGILDGRVSQDDIDKVSDIRNHSEFEDGFGGDDSGLFGGDDMSDFDDLNDLFGDSGSSSDGFGDSSFGDNSSGGGSSNSSFGGGGNTFGNSGDTFGGSGFGNGGSSFGGGNSFGGGFGGGGNTFGSNGGFGGNSLFPQNNQQAQPQQPDTMDKLMDASVTAAQNIGEILLDMIKSLKDRNADDFGYLGTNLIKAGICMAPSGFILGIVGALGQISALGWQGLPLNLMLSGGMCLGTGAISLGASALVLTKAGDREIGSMDDIPNNTSENSATDDYEDSAGDIMDDLFGDDFDSMFDSADTNESTFDNFNSIEPEETPAPEPIDDIEPEPIDYNALIANVPENSFMSRKTLVETFCSLFRPNTPGFADKKDVIKDSSDWQTLETICMKALSNLTNQSFDEIDTELDSASETLFSYELKLKRINKVKKPEELAKEIELYMKDDENPNVTVTATISGDFYKIIITKGENPVVTFGDVFNIDYCKEFFLNERNKLPMITGITDLGKVILDDAKSFDTMLIAGKPRSGKSWYVLSILISLMLFNLPEDVQFIIIDPKESNLFFTMSYMPHVCGIHNDKQILKILDDIIEVEAPRRRKLLSDNKCDDIWALRSKGIKLPVLYLVIDEYITLYNNLNKDQQKEFDSKIQTLISQLPFLGIRLLFVPHRATGVVNKTNRTMLQFTAAVRADIEDVKDTLGINSWSRALTKPGDIAVKNSSMTTATFVKGAALTPSDEENAKFIESAAKVFYKMGVDMPDMTNMRIACNRNEEKIREELMGDNNRIQYDASTLLDDIDDVDVAGIGEGNTESFDLSAI